MEHPLIYDIGMNNGDDTAYYLSLGCKVIAVEAIAALVSQAEKRFKSYIQSKQLIILNIGLTESEGYIDFYVNKYDSGWSSFHVNLAERGNLGYDIIKVKTKSLGQLLGEYGVPYYLKVDIEGNDRIVLEALSKLGTKPKYLSMELYNLEEIVLISQLGYSKFKIIDQQNFLPLEVPSTAEHNVYKNLCAFNTSKNFGVRVIRKLFGKVINQIMERKFKRVFHYDHPLGSSGTFGEHLPGKWHSLEEIREVFPFYKQRFEQLAGNKAYGWWIDIHAQY